MRDLAVKTPGFSLEVSRRYESSRYVDGPLGISWTSNLTARVYYDTYLFSAPSTYKTGAVVTMPNGMSYVFVQNADGSFAPPLGSRDTLVRNGDGSFDLTFEFTSSKIHFASDGSWRTMTDDYGNALTATYDVNGRLQQVADSAGSGRYLNIFWGADGRISSVQDSSGRQVQFTYTPQGALQTVTDPASRVTTHSYVTGRFAPMLSQIADNWNRVITAITYDTSDRVATYTESGETFTYTYTYNGNPLMIAKTDSFGNRRVFTVSGSFITDTVQPPGGGGTRHLDIAPDGSILMDTDGVGVKTAYSYDTAGRVATVTKDYQGPSTVRFDYVYDAAFPAKVTSVTAKNPSTNAVDPSWQSLKYDYYQAGSPAPGALFHSYRIHDDGVTVDTVATYIYDTHGRVTRMTNAIGSATDYVYNATGDLFTVTAPSNNDAGTRPVTTYGYDAVGRVTSVSDALLHATSYGYDAVDRVTTVTLPKPSSGSPLVFLTSYTYDNFDAGTGLTFTNVTDPNALVTKQGYDQYVRLVKSVDALSATTTYGYTNALLTSITDANGNVTGYTYDPSWRLTYTIFPDAAMEHYTYYADDRLFQKADRKGQTMVFSYDGLKRLAVKGYPNFTSITFTYSGQKLMQVVDSSVAPTETHTFAYDGLYRRTSDTQGPRGTITYQFNADDTTLSYAVQSGPGAAYTYYPDGSLDTIAWTPVAGSFKYKYVLTGRYQGITFPNGQTRNFSYDDQGRLTQLTNLLSGGGNLASYAYGYDLNYTTGLNTRLGQRVSVTATVPSQGLSNHLFKYEYDASYQLSKATYPGVAPFSGEVDSWTYDGIGNRLTSTINGSTTNYAYQKITGNPNNWQRLTSDGVNSYGYDSNGNTATRTGLTFGWSYDDRMTSISGSTSASYLYDYQSRRSNKTVGSTTSYLYDGLNLIRESSTSSADYLFGPGIDEPLAMSRGGQVYNDATDALGSVVLVTSSAGVVQDGYVYDAWGQVKSQTGSLGNPFVYTARETGEAGLEFYRARFYQSGIGRFLSEDPAQGAAATYDIALASVRGFSGAGVPVIDPSGAGLRSLYSYAENSALNFTDPFGLCSYPALVPDPRPRPTPTPVPKDWCDPEHTNTRRGCLECCIQRDRENRKKCKYTGGVTIFCREVVSGKAFNECGTDCVANHDQ